MLINKLKLSCIISKDTEIKDWQESFIENFNSHKNDRLSLPYIYLFILKHFLANLASGKYDFSPKEYKNLIYYDLNDKQIPLFVKDPLKIIDELINSLDILWRANHDEIKKFKIFRLLNYNILQGKKDGELKWKTLIAYCGGWDENRSKCGKNPLILGKEQHCPECGKLICSKCGFCSINCRYGKQRQEGYIAKQKPQISSALL